MCFLPKNSLKLKGKTIAEGELAFVQEIELARNKGRPEKLAARFSGLDPVRKGQKNEKAMFYELKIAKSLFPQNFVEVLGAKLKGKGITYGRVLLRRIEKEQHTKSCTKMKYT